MELNAIIEEMQGCIFSLQQRVEELKGMNDKSAETILLTRQEAADLLGKSQRQLDRDCRRYGIRKVAANGGVRIAKIDLLVHMGLGPSCWTAAEQTGASFMQTRLAMNYLAEIRHFYDWLETESMPSNAIVLWHALMFTANRCGWREEFSVPFSVLENRTKLDKSTICRMRRILVERGVLSVRCQRGRRRAVYPLNLFERHPAEHDTAVSATQIHLMTGKTLQSATPTATVSIQDRIIPEKEKTSKKEKAPRRREERKGCAEKREPMRQNLLQFLALLNEVWRAPMSLWLEYKRSRREGCRSEMGARKCLALLRDLSGNDPAVAVLKRVDALETLVQVEDVVECFVPPGVVLCQKPLHFAVDILGWRGLHAAHLVGQTLVVAHGEPLLAAVGCAGLELRMQSLDEGFGERLPGWKYQARQGALDAENRRHRRLDHGSRRVGEGAGGR